MCLGLGTGGGAFAVTVTLHSAVLLPSSVVTIITASPALCAVTFPVASTLAISCLSELHVMFLFVAFAGAIVAVSFSFCPSSSVTALLFSATPVTATATGGFTLKLTFTVTAAVTFTFAALLPSVPVLLSKLPP